MLLGKPLRALWFLYNSLSGNYLFLSEMKNEIGTKIMNESTIVKYEPKIKIETRIKEAERIIHKTLMKRKPVYDILGMRIIVEPKHQRDESIFLIYYIAKLIDSEYEVKTQNTDDYVYYKKQNGYQSYHIEIYHKKKKLEIQIRNKAMDIEAQNGRASIYK